MSSIPFQLPDVGLREIAGKLYLDEDFLTFYVEDALVGEFDKEQHVIKVEPSALQEVWLDHGVVQDRLYIRPKRDDLLKAMPGQYSGELCLKIWRKHRSRAEALVEELRQRSRAD